MSAACQPTSPSPGRRQVVAAGGEEEQFGRRRPETSSLQIKYYVKGAYKSNERWTRAVGTNATWTSILPLNLLSATIFKMEDTTA